MVKKVKKSTLKTPHLVMKKLSTANIVNAYRRPLYNVNLM
jgi:hypothetical protein